MAVVGGVMRNNITLYEFLMEAELGLYYEPLKNELKIQTVSQLKYVEEEDLSNLGMTKPEQRRLRKFFEKYYPKTYLNRIKKMILPKNKEGVDNLGTYYDGSSFSEMSNKQAAPAVKVPSKHIISADSIVTNKELGVGEFGVVQQGVWTNEDGERIQVAIKCLSKQRMPNNSMDFLKEAAMMHSIDHEHIVRLYGVVFDFTDASTLMLVTELAPLRSLLECLKEPALRPSFPVISLSDFAHQICDGMRYLENKRLIHRDLAARNILVFAKNRVKISDFGLSRALEVEKDYYQTKFNVNLKLPIAWCAPECINFLKFTSASDAWAYGVTLWEMFSYGFQPWAALTGHEILTTIDKPKFQRLEKPECCPKDYYSLMLKCWEHEPENRPKFSDIGKWLPDCRPELVQAVKEFIETSTSNSPVRLKKDYLQYKTGDIITVLDKKPDMPASKPTASSSSAVGGMSSATGSVSSFASEGQTSTLWKGVINSGKTGYFYPSDTVAYLGQNLPASSNSGTSSNGNSNSGSNFIRGIIDVRNGGNGIYSSKRRLRPEMISRPQADLKHTGHVGADGAFFGDISFLGDKYHQLPAGATAGSSSVRQSGSLNSDDKSRSLRNSSDLSDKTPLLTQSTSIIEHRNGSSSNHFLDHASRGRNGLKPGHNQSKRDGFASKNGGAGSGADTDHEYHEISSQDEENLGYLESPHFETFDFGPSLMDEVFRELDILKPGLSNAMSMSEQQQTLNDCNTNVKNEIKEMASKLAISSKENGKVKKSTVKHISAADKLTLDSAIAMAKELACQSMHDLDGLIDNPGFHGDTAPNSADSPKTPTSPHKKNKFSFKFKTSPKAERRNFSAETENISDIQSIITDEAKEAYCSLIERRDSCDKPRNETTCNAAEKWNYQVPSVNFGHHHHVRQDSHEAVDPAEPESEANPLRLLRNGGVNVVPKRGNKQRFSAAPQTASLARLTASVNRSALGTPPPVPPAAGESSVVGIVTSAPNLPPRDRTKPQQLQLKHHQRKHPLILPNSVTGSPNGSAESLTANGIAEHSSSGPVLSTFRPHMPVLKQVSCPEAPASYLSNLRRSSESNENSSLLPACNSQLPPPPPKPARSYLIDDSFESQIQAAIDNLDSVKESNGKNSTTIHDHRVSCEDLLDFAVDKPHDDQRNGNRSAVVKRGLNSDEVRVMQKVLANEVTLVPEECVKILDGTNWDVHKAIKCVRLRETLKVHAINLDCNWIEMLSKFNWNIRQASNYLIATHGLPEDTTEV